MILLLTLEWHLARFWRSFGRCASSQVNNLARQRQHKSFRVFLALSPLQLLTALDLSVRLAYLLRLTLKCLLTRSHHLFFCFAFCFVACFKSTIPRVNEFAKSTTTPQVNTRHVLAFVLWVKAALYSLIAASIRVRSPRSLPLAHDTELL